MAEGRQEAKGLPEITLHAVVLRRRDAGESDRRLTLLTEEVGVTDVVAKGARKGGSRLAGSSEPLNVCVFQVATGKRTQYVTQSQPITSFPALRSDYERLSFALALTELASALLPHGSEASEEFRFVVGALRYLEVHEKPIVALVWAQMKLMELAGFHPEFDRCVVTGGSIGEADAWVSPHAGGYVSPESATRYSDRFRMRAEALYGAARVVQLDVPPTNLRFAAEIFCGLLRFWTSQTDDKLPANRQVADQLQHELQNPSVKSGP